jgi:hypothetical protein
MTARFQSTSHIMMCEPVKFYANPQTMADNVYQSGDQVISIADIQAKAVHEMRSLRDKLVSMGVLVSTYRGQPDCPDDIFCNNWVSTHADGGLVYYPMYVPNRRLERRADITAWLEKRYKVKADLTHFEADDLALESTGSLVLDRVNRLAYCALSQRAQLDVLQRWAVQTGYTPMPFRTQTEEGLPVYHTNVMMFIGSGYAGICPDVILPEDRETVLMSLAKTGHDVVTLSAPQVRQFCRSALLPQQRDVFLRHVTDIISADIGTIEHYGGGSARCMLLELF